MPGCSAGGDGRDGEGRDERRCDKPAYAWRWGSRLARRVFGQLRADDLGAHSGLQEHIRLLPSPVSGSPPAPSAFGGDPPGEHALADPGIHHQHRG